METVDNEYQPNMGQRVELSFSDAKIINLAYCKSESLSITSQVLFLNNRQIL